MAAGGMAREKDQAGARGLPVGMIAFYGPDNRRATKVAVGIVPAPQSEERDAPMVWRNRRRANGRHDPRRDRYVLARA